MFEGTKKAARELLEDERAFAAYASVYGLGEALSSVLRPPESDAPVPESKSSVTHLNRPESDIEQPLAA